MPEEVLANAKVGYTLLTPIVNRDNPEMDASLQCDVPITIKLRQKPAAGTNVYLPGSSWETDS